MERASADDFPTLAALGVVAFALADVSHEALGHGLATLAVGGRPVLWTTCYFSSSGSVSRWIPAAGGLTNLLLGTGAIAILRLRSQLSSLLRYFVVLVAAFNLFFAFGYPAYSGVAQFGDWAQVISGLEPEWLWRVLLIAVAIAGYYGSMKLLVDGIAPFSRLESTTAGGSLNKSRLQRITLTPYFAALILASMAGALNPSGWLTMLTAGLPAAAAAFGLTQMDHLVVAKQHTAFREAAPPILRSYSWIVAATAVLILFVGVLGPGIQFR